MRRTGARSDCNHAAMSEYSTRKENRYPVQVADGFARCLMKVMANALTNSMITWWTVNEERLKKGLTLLQKIPQLKSKKDIFLIAECRGEDIVLLCELLKTNAIPTRKLELRSAIILVKKSNFHSWNQIMITGNEMRLEGAQSLSESLLCNMTLTELNLCGDGTMQTSK